jgi:hypothetical protein
LNTGEGKVCTIYHASWHCHISSRRLPELARLVAVILYSDQQTGTKIGSTGRAMEDPPMEILD